MSIPRLDLEAFRHRRTPAPAFSQDAGDRPLRVLIDDRIVTRSGDPAFDHLKQFARHPLIKMVGLEPLAAPSASPLPGRLIIMEPNEVADQVPYFLDHGDAAFISAFYSYKGRVMEAQTMAAATGLPFEECLQEMLRAWAAGHWPFDALVTSSRTLLTSDKRWIQAANPMRPAEALALVGLFLRRRNDHVWQIDGGFHKIDSRSSTYHLAARAAFGSEFRFHYGAAESSLSTGDNTAMQLAETVTTRFERALLARDYVMAELQTPHRAAATFDFLYHLDSLLVQLVGAFDAIARVADLAVTPTTTAGILVSWRTKAWRKALLDEPSAATLKAPLDGNATTRNVIDLLWTLRNNIHGDVLHVDQPTQPHSSDRFAVRLPEADRTDVLNALARLGGPARWGVEVPAAGDLVIDTAAFVEKLIVAARNALDELMATTPVEILPGANGPSLPAAADPNDLFLGTEIADALRRLFGLG